jgi:adenylosuccinate lyase
VARQEAYELVQRYAMRAWAGEAQFRELLEADPEVVSRLGTAAIAACFDLAHVLRHVDAIIDRALSTETEAE